MHYLIEYTAKLFEYEKRNIGEALANLRKYQEYFGDELLVSPLLEGITKNINSYFRENRDEYNALMKAVDGLTKTITHYIATLERSKGVSFRLSKYFEE